MSGKDFIFLEPNDDLQSVLSCMEQNLISHIPIVQDKKIVGIVSKTDVIHFLNEEHEKRGETLFSTLIKEIKVKEMMIQPVLHASVDDTQMQMIEKMIQKNIGSLVLYKDKEIVGIVTERDMVRFLSYKQDEGQNFAERFGYHLVQWLDTHGVIRVSRFLSDMGI